MSDDTPVRFIKPAVRAVAAYTLKARQAPVKINQNENPFDLPAEIKRRVVERALARPWARYPDFEPTELIRALARHAGWRPDGVLAGNGSNELIQATLMVSVGAGTHVVIPEPTFSLYELLVTILGGESVRVPLGPQFAFDVDALVAAQRRATATVNIICSPNNPTGGALSPDDLRRLCRAVDGLVVVDEAYGEFADRSVVPLLAECRNLIVLKTFSKAMALGGLRIGYLLAAPELVVEINKARLPYNVNFFSQLAAIAAMEEAATLQAAVRQIVALRQRLLEQLARIPGIKPFPSHGNFILFELEAHEPAVVFQRLYEQGVLVRDVSKGRYLERCLRVSVGTADENARFLDALHAALGGRPAAVAR